MTALAFIVHPTPLADVLLAQTDRGLVSAEVITDDGWETDAVLRRLAERLGTLPGRDVNTAADARRQLDEYADGSRRTFELTLDWQLVHGFARDALQQACTIPYGQTAGYGEVAAMAGRPRAARAVGNACARSPFSIIVPVHRVVHADGSLGGYGGRTDIKQSLLDHERAHTRAASDV